MKQFQIYVLWAGLFLPFLLSAGEPGDNAKAGPDGPHVFYRNGQIVVKSLEIRDTGVVVRTTNYTDRRSVLLTCRLPESSDNFSFTLKDTLTIPPDQYSLPGKMLVLSDIEGDFPAFRTMLQGAKVINRDMKWTFGNGHLVLLGDFVDRGYNVTECLWLIYKLESEAEKAGGKVHYILGNHEILNMEGVTDYVRGKYLANAKLMGEDYPKWFDTNSELGRWMRTKNVVERIGDYVFCHGGISPELMRTKLSLTDINKITRQFMGKPSNSISGANPKAVFDRQTGIFWFRGASKNQVSPELITEILAYAGAKRMVVGHCVVPDLTAQYGGRVICIDLFHEDNMRRGFMKTLWIEDGFLYGIDSHGTRSSVFTVTYQAKERDKDQ